MNNIADVFLGGTCNNSQWREIIKPLLHKSFFDPVVPNWSPECQSEELRQRQDCQFCLYAITPRMTGVYSVAEVIDDSNKRPAHTVFVPLLIDDELSFTAPQWKSLQAVAAMVERNGGHVFYSLQEAAEYINSK